MEQKHVLLSALSVGIGLGVGLGLSSGQDVSKWVCGDYSSGEILEEQIETELMKLVANGENIKVTFEDFPYYLCEKTRVLLTSAAYVHLKHSDISMHTRNLSPASRAIMLSGQDEIYHQTLAKALAHNFKSKLLLLDITDFSLKMQIKYGCQRKEQSFKGSITEATLERMSSWFDSFTIVPASRATSGMKGSLSSKCPATNSATLKNSSSWCFDEKQLLRSLYRVLISKSETSSIILYIRDIEKLLLQSKRMYNLFQKMLKKLSGSVFILGSRVFDQEDDDSRQVDEMVTALLPYNIEIRPPEDKTHLDSWKAQLEEDMRILQFRDNKNHIAQVLAANNIECNDLASICQTDTMVIGNHIEEIVVSAISYHLMNNKDPEYRNGKLVISSQSLSHVLSIFQEGENGGTGTLKLESHVESSMDIEGEDGTNLKTESQSKIPALENKFEASTLKKDGENSPSPKPEVPPDNRFEKQLRSEIIPASEICVTFADIGAMDEIKESLQELVMLPLRRPDIFKGELLKPCRGILLFGPPGTGKTMLAKAIANEAGASFINVSMSTLTAKWFGEQEKIVRAIFTLAAKVAPTIIFVDEVDSMLGQRTRDGEHECTRKIKNEFMIHWDGLLTKPGQKILVLAATNRPFDLDEAVIRRFERRIMVGLPSIENREMILRTLLSKENVENLEFKELATMTEGFSGSDLKNLCKTAAFQPVRELLQQERLKDKEKKMRELKGKCSEDNCTNEENKEELVISLRPLNMEDMKHAKNQVAASSASEGWIMSELKWWNELYGEGGSRKKQQLTYFL